MAFDDFEASQRAGNIVQLYKFVYGTDPSEYFAYTDHTEELTVDAITYEPVPIERDTIDSNGTLDKSELKVRIDVGTGLSELFRVYPPSDVVTLIMKQGHIGDPDSEFLVVWAGRITASGRQGSMDELTGEPVSTSLRRVGLRRRYQFGCPHALYGPQCRADKPSKTVSSTIAAIAGATVTLAGGWEGAFPADKFAGGLLEWPAPGGSTTRRTILRVTGDVLSLSGIPNDLAVSDAVDVVLGCNHKAYAEQDGDCLPLFNNINNYGGCLWIPLKNPIGTYNNFY